MRFPSVFVMLCSILLVAGPAAPAAAIGPHGLELKPSHGKANQRFTMVHHGERDREGNCHAGKVNFYWDKKLIGQRQIRATDAVCSATLANILPPAGRNAPGRHAVRSEFSTPMWWVWHDEIYRIDGSVQPTRRPSPKPKPSPKPSVKPSLSPTAVVSSAAPSPSDIVEETTDAPVTKETSNSSGLLFTLGGGLLFLGGGLLVWLIRRRRADVEA